MLATDFSKARSVGDVAAHQAKVCELIRHTLLPGVQSEVSRWFAGLAGPGVIEVDLSLTDKYGLRLTLKGPATVTVADKKLALDDASGVTATMYDARGRRVVFNPRVEVRGLDARLGFPDWGAVGTWILVAFSMVDITAPRLEALLY